LNHKVFLVKDLQDICVIGLGLLGGSVSLAARQRFAEATVTGYSHRATTRRKARELAVASVVADDLASAVKRADLVILATPIFTFERYFEALGGLARAGCIVTDVGSTKMLPHRWAEETLGGRVRYVGSHPVAGSEQRGVEFARDDLFAQSRCIVTTTEQSDRFAVRTLKRFWSALGCFVDTMDPVEHDRIFANISHLPHLMAAGLVNASDRDDMKFAGKGFLDSTRIASGAASVWTDVLLANAENLITGIDRAAGELSELRRAIRDRDRKALEAFLDGASKKRAWLVKYKIRKKELLS
jgi:prephenate dehydrogenase